MSMAQGVSPGRVAIKGIHSLSLWERVRVREFLTGTDPRVPLDERRAGSKRGAARQNKLENKPSVMRGLYP